jgi:hypothetical protein
MAKRLPLIEQLDSMTIAQLQHVWGRLYGRAAPSLSPDLLRRGLAYRLQEKKKGGLDQQTKKYLERYAGKAGLADAKPPLGAKLSVGTKLVRDWHGVGHSVTVLDDGFDYEGRHLRSLTAIARHITGTKWSGPRFFGLTAKGPAL